MTSRSEMSVQPFSIPYDPCDVEDVMRRLECSRLSPSSPYREWNAGTPRELLEEAIKYWRTTYDWKRAVCILNSFNNYKCKVKGTEIHFIHERTSAEERVPLLLIHGWPGSVFEFNQLIPLLTKDQNGKGFEVVAPSLPGYAWSGKPDKEGMDVFAIADLFDTLMQNLGYSQYVVQGGDWGGIIARALGRKHHTSCVGLHVNFLVCTPPPVTGIGSLWFNIRYISTLLLAPLLMNRKDAQKVSDTKSFLREGTGYQWIQATRPSTLGHGLNDSPAGLLSWLLEKFYSWSDSMPNDPFRSVSLDDILTHVMIYWTTQTISSSMNLYYESLAVMRTKPLALSSGYIDVPTAVAEFPREIIQTPKCVVRRCYNLQEYTVYHHGGHFPALEQPQLLAEDIRRFYFNRTTFKNLLRLAEKRSRVGSRVLPPMDMIDLFSLSAVVVFILYFCIG